MKKIKVVVIRPYNEREVLEVENKLEVFQELVGGYVEPIYRPDDTILLVNEEGNLIGLEANILGLVGNIVIVHNGGEEFESLTDEEIEEWYDNNKIC